MMCCHLPTRWRWKVKQQRKLRTVSTRSLRAKGRPCWNNSSSTLVTMQWGTDLENTSRYMSGRTRGEMTSSTCSTNTQIKMSNSSVLSGSLLQGWINVALMYQLIQMDMLLNLKWIKRIQMNLKRNLEVFTQILKYSILMERQKYIKLW